MSEEPQATTEQAALPIEPAAPPAAAPAEPAPADNSAGGSLDAALAGVEQEIEQVAEQEGPPIEHAVWNAMKAWVRREIDLARQGHSEQTRQDKNP